MKRPILLIFTLAFLIAACRPSEGAATPIEILVVTEPPPAMTIPAECNAASGVSLSAIPERGDVIVQAAGLVPGESVHLEFYLQGGDESMTSDPVDPIGSDGTFADRYGLDPGIWQVQLHSQAGVTCQIVIVP